MATEIDGDLGAVRQLFRRPVCAEIARGGLTGPEQSATGTLIASEDLSVRDLSRELGLGHSTVSGTVDRLEKQGSVDRQPDQADRRIGKIIASAAVHEFVAKTMPWLKIHPLAQALRGATPSELRQVRKGKRVMRALPEREGGRSPARKAE
jgi:DNA-binding MarR family transcriptional regulator